MQDVSSPQISAMCLTPMKTKAAEQWTPDRSAILAHQAIRSFTELVRPYERSAYLAALAIAADPAMAERIVFEATYSIHREMLYGMQIERLRSRLIESVVSVGRDLVGLTESEEHETWEASIVATMESSHLDSDQGAQRETLMIALMTLPQFQRVVITLRDILHLASSEIAQILSIPLSHVTGALSRARFGLYRRLSTSTQVTTHCSTKTD